MIYVDLLTAIGLSPGGSTHLHTNSTQNNTNNNLFGRVRTVPRLCEFYPGICLTTEGKAGKNLSQCKETSVRVRKTSVKVQYAYYQNTHTLQNLHTHTHTHTQNNIKPPQYKLKQTQYKIYPNKIVTI